MVERGATPIDGTQVPTRGAETRIRFDVMLVASDVRKAFLALPGARILLSALIAAMVGFGYAAIGAAREAGAGRGFAFWMLASFFVWLVSRMLYFQPREALERFGKKPIEVRLTEDFVEMAQSPSYSRFAYRDLKLAEEDPDAFLLRTDQHGVIVLPKRGLGPAEVEGMRELLRARVGLMAVRFRPETIPFVFGGTAAALLFYLDWLR